MSHKLFPQPENTKFYYEKYATLARALPRSPINLNLHEPRTNPTISIRQVAEDFIQAKYKRIYFWLVLFFLTKIL